MAENARWREREGSTGLASSPHVTAGAAGFASAEGFFGVSQTSQVG